MCKTNETHKGRRSATTVTHLKNELLQPQKRLLVRNLLTHLRTREHEIQTSKNTYAMCEKKATHLHHSVPRILGLEVFAVFALLAGHDVLNDEHLLQDRARKNLLLHRQLQLQSSRMRLSPDPAGVHKAHHFAKLVGESVKLHANKARREGAQMCTYAFDSLQQQRHELARLRLACDLTRHQTVRDTKARKSRRCRYEPSWPAAEDSVRIRGTSQWCFAVGKGVRPPSRE